MTSAQYSAIVQELLTHPAIRPEQVRFLEACNEQLKNGGLANADREALEAFCRDVIADYRDRKTNGGPFHLDANAEIVSPEDAEITGILVAQLRRHVESPQDIAFLAECEAKIATGTLTVGERADIWQRYAGVNKLLPSGPSGFGRFVAALSPWRKGAA